METEFELIKLAKEQIDICNGQIDVLYQRWKNSEITREMYSSKLTLWENRLYESQAKLRTLQGNAVNKLVYHKGSEGICVISKELKNHYIINVGLHRVKTVKKSTVTFIDTGNCKVITFSDLKNKLMSNKLNEEVIIGNELKKSVGIGLISIRIITESDLNKYKRVI